MRQRIDVPLRLGALVGHGEQPQVVAVQLQRAIAVAGHAVGLGRVVQQRRIRLGAERLLVQIGGLGIVAQAVGGRRLLV